MVSNVVSALTSFVDFVAPGLYLAVDSGVYIRGLVRFSPWSRRAGPRGAPGSRRDSRTLAGGQTHVMDIGGGIATGGL
jgi:hypothetical protein